METRRMAKRHPRCPPVRMLLASLGGEGGEPIAAPWLVRHLAQCAWCQQEVEVMQACLQGEVVEEVAAAYWDEHVPSGQEPRRWRRL